MKTLDYYIKHLIEYALVSELIDEDERYYSINRLLQIYNRDDFTDPPIGQALPLADILEGLVEVAIAMGLITDTVTERDLFDTQLMDAVTPRPSQVIAKFNRLYRKSPQTATDYFYKLAGDSNYIRRSRIVKDLRWNYESEYGTIAITVNLSKPEKDPKAIAAAKNSPAAKYPKCPLCVENVGYWGSLTQAARQTLRVIPLSLDSQKWALQYSPYVYYPEHCIVLNQSHQPMKIDDSTFSKLLDFVDLFPHYFVGSNADLPIVGGSILAHDHFQGGNYCLPMARASVRFSFELPEFEDVECGVLKWPVSVVRLSARSKSSLIEAAAHIFNVWKSYDDSSIGLRAYSGATRHNTVTPIARFHDGRYELDLALRNNRTTEERPLGIFHPRPEYWNIKKENIGLIEVMGLAVLPRRLKDEMLTIRNCILRGKPIEDELTIAKHASWVNSFLSRYAPIGEQNIDGILQDEIGKIFVKVLEDTGIFKNDALGEIAFKRFVETLCK